MKIFLQILCLIPICIGIILGYPLTILAIAWDVAQDHAKKLHDFCNDNI